MNGQVISMQDFNGVSMQVMKINGNDSDLWFTGEEIGSALGLEDSKDAINKIFQRHRDELEEYSALVTLPTSGGPQETRIFSEEGAYMITFFSQAPKAKAFRRWVARLLKDYRLGKLSVGPGSEDWARQVRMECALLRAQCQLHSMAKAQAETIIRGEGSIEDLGHVPVIQEAVRRIVQGDPRARQLRIW